MNAVQKYLSVDEVGFSLSLSYLMLPFLILPHLTSPCILLPLLFFFLPSPFSFYLSIHLLLLLLLHSPHSLTHS